MNLFRRAFLLLTVCVLTFGVSPVSANNGMEFYEDSFSETIYVDCLGEYVNLEARASAAFHMFTTPSGNIHIVDNWKLSVMWTGVSTDRIWVGQLNSPLQINITPAYVEQWTLHGVQKPMTEGAPKFFWKSSFKATVNANGDLVVLMGPVDSVRCIGKK